ncbi:hypothetical protein [Lysinibacillus sphaericus]|uniref:hypothetical protein n=1 Tax=Lysinibacillus sphaericus TaxID=1421 RepID=UPI00248C0FDF|nr:hypothetical protein [Lysinibacillus sphaericus]
MKIEIPKGVKLYRIIGSNLTMFGISVVISYFLSLYLEDNWSRYHSLYKNVKVFDVLWIAIGLYFILFGITLLAQFDTEEKIRNFEELEISFAIKQFPFTIVFAIALFYLFNPLLVKSPNWVSENFYIVTIMNILVIYIALAISVKIIQNSFSIFKNSIPDSKDRLTFIVTVFATIISAIALFK